MADVKELPNRPAKPPRVAAIGLASWDRLLAVDRYPGAGEFAVVAEEQTGPGGTTANAAVTLAPVVGRLAARELVGGTVEPALAGCRLDRV